MTAAELHIVGAGQLGRTLGRLWHRTEAIAIGEVVCRSRASARAAVDFIGGGRPRVGTGWSPADGDLVLLSTPDDALAGAAADLVAACRARRGLVAFHCSGALSSDVLQPLAAVGVAVASVHPLRSFADPAVAAAGFAGTWCGVEGETRALQRLRPLFEGAGGCWLPLRGEAKALYHAGAVVASNYLVALMAMALRLFEAAGIEQAEARRLLRPLAGGTLDNVLAQGAPAALSGPILRGDVATVERQLAALVPLGLDGAYRELGRITLGLARQRGLADPAALAAIDGLLGQSPVRDG